LAFAGICPENRSTNMPTFSPKVERPSSRTKVGRIIAIIFWSAYFDPLMVGIKVMIRWIKSIPKKRTMHSMLTSIKMAILPLSLSTSGKFCLIALFKIDIKITEMIVY